jgi:8-oxo-dGTP pyrophosphatase MutT (NUDIX family)
MNDTSTTRRCALIYHCQYQGEIHLLLGYIGGELTSIGGRKDKGETDVECCCREAFEETKELVDYRPHKFGLNIGTIYTFSGCAYYIIQEQYEDLSNLCENFKKTHSDRKEQNELSELILFDLSKLAEVLILNRIAYKEELKEFILTILYRLLKPSPNKGLFTIEVDEPAELFVSLKDLPITIDLVSKEALLKFRNKPKVYGKTLNTNLFITECAFDECNLFRSGISME